MTDGKKPKTNIILPKINKPDNKNLRSDFKNSHKQNSYNAPLTGVITKTIKV